MQRAKAFLFISCGLFLLVLSYNLGARAAGAQSGAALSFADINAQHDEASAVMGRTVYFLGIPPNRTGFAGSSQPVPGSSPIIATMYDDGNMAAVLSNGDCYYASSGSPGWTLVGNVVGTAPVNAASASWGQLKARYR
jgi:hypothetical protein